jgi:hypothetical protein
MQMLLPRTESVGQTQQNENQRVVNENTYAANEVAKEVQHNSETVIPKDASQFEQYQYDAREEGNGTYDNPRKRKKRRGQGEHKSEDDRDTENEFGARDKQPRVNIQI